jgi:hypothetical protein
VKTSKFQLAVLRSGHSSLVNIALNKTFSFAGAVQWDGTALAIGDYEHNAIVRFKISGKRGRKVGETHLDGASFPIGVWIQGSTVIAANDDSGTVMYWNYPAGGTNTKTIDGLSYPLSTVVSLASQ